MKMQTTLYSNADGIVEEIHAQIGDTVETKDLLVRLRARFHPGIGASCLQKGLILAYIRLS